METDLSKLFALLLALVAGIAIVELATAPSPSSAVNPRVTDGVYQRIAVGMTERQLQDLLGRPNEVRGGEMVRFEEPGSETIGHEILELPRTPARDVLQIYYGLNDERILVLLSATDHVVLAAQYSIAEIPVLYRGYRGSRGKAISALSLDRPMDDDLRNKVERFLINWAQHKDRSNVPGELIVHWDRMVTRPGAVPPPPPPPPEFADMPNAPPVDR